MATAYNCKYFFDVIAAWNMIECNAGDVVGFTGHLAVASWSICSEA